MNEGKNEKEIRLKVGELTAREEAGRGIVRIDSSNMNKIGVKEGDVVEIEGSKKTAAIAVRAYPADVGLNIIRMDGITRRNAGSGVGEYVKVRKAEVKEAKKVTIAPAEKGFVVHVSPTLVKQNLYMRPVVKGDIIVPSPVVRRRSRGGGFFEEFFGSDFFEEFFFTPFPGETRFIVTNTDPSGIVRIGDMTELEILPELPESLKLEEKTIPAVTYEDIGGIKDVVEKVREMVELPLRHPEIFERLGIDPPKGVLLYGPPGTGKTLLAKAVANESGANFFSISGPEIMCVDETTPIIYNNKIEEVGKVANENKDKVLAQGINFTTFFANGKISAIGNPSFEHKIADLTEITKIEVPYYYHITTETATYNISSNHPLLLFSESGICWKTPPFITENDYLLVKPIENLQPPQINFSSTKISVPKNFTTELSYLMGLMAGGGYVGEDGVCFCGKDTKLHRRFKKIIKRFFGITKFSEYRDKKGNIRTVVYSKDLVRFFNFAGFESGKKDYKQFIDEFLSKFDKELFISFLLGLIHTDGRTKGCSIIIYSADAEALQKIRKIAFSRGILFTKPIKHTNKWSDVYRIELKGKYNLLSFKKAANKLPWGKIKLNVPKNSFEKLPSTIFKILKKILKKYGIPYGKNYSIEPSLNLRFSPNKTTLEKILELLKKKKIENNDKVFINFLKKLLKNEIILEKIEKMERKNEKKLMYDLGTTEGNFLTAFGHIMHNSKFYGESEANLRKIFEEAEKNAPSIIFIDEIDAIAPKREETTGEVERRVTSQLLTLMDGLKKRGKVVVIAATNRPNAIDPALRRGGRFDREIEIPVPDRNGRLEIFKIHTRNMPLDKDVDLNWLADITYGYVGADIMALCKEAAMSALRRVLPEIKWKEETELPKEVMEKLVVKKEDFENALKVVEPSAMREVLVEVPKVKWEDIGDLEEVKQQLKEMVEWPLKYPESFEKMGITPPKGILLYGPPGCGKTLLAKAVANESGANFIAIKGPEVLTMWVGESERKIRELFRRARQVAPAIIFFDEIDALAPRRGLYRGSAVTETVVSQLLTELSGIEETKGVVVIAATNRPDIVDPALLRPGRIDRFVLIPPPNTRARFEILKIHTRNMPLDKDVDLKEIAEKTEGFSGADLEALCREAAMNALREDLKAKVVKMKHFEQAFKKITPSLTKDMQAYYEKFLERQKKREIEEEKEQFGYIG